MMKSTMFLAFFAFCITAEASTLFDFDFTSGTGVTGQAFGNLITSSNNGVTITETAWGITGTNLTTFQIAQLSKYIGAGLGLGVCNQLEGLNCDDPAHQVDNSGQYDFVMFQFSKPVDPTTVTIKPYGNVPTGYDRDVTYLVGNSANPLNLTGMTLANLASLGFTSFNDDSTVSTQARTVNIGGSTSVNTLIFGARVNGDSNIDRFKINDLAGTVSAPEPGTFLEGAVLLLAFSRFIGRKKRLA